VLHRAPRRRHVVDAGDTDMRSGSAWISLFLLASLGCSSGIISGSGEPPGALGNGGTSAVASSGGATSSSGATNATAGTSSVNPASGGTTSTIDLNAAGLPCEVSYLLEHYCAGCHSSPPSGGAPEPLLKYADLMATAKLDPSQKLGALSLAYIQNGTMPPKPLATPTAAELAPLQTWVNAGMPMSGCSTAVDAGTPIANPYDTPLTCTSGTHWTQGDRGSDNMHPGVACVACHQTSGGEAPKLAIGGTVYRTAHEPDDCNGTTSGTGGQLTVVITEANGTVHNLPVASSGNFFLRGSITTPYKAQVNSGSSMRVMTHTQTSGDCNGCHSVNGTTNQTGTDPAPGRIMAP